MRLIGATVIAVGVAWVTVFWGLEFIGAIMRVYDGRLGWSGFTWHYSPFNLPTWAMRLIMGGPGLIAIAVGTWIHRRGWCGRISRLRSGGMWRRVYARRRR